MATFNKNGSYKVLLSMIVSQKIRIFVYFVERLHQLEIVALLLVEGVNEVQQVALYGQVLPELFFFFF